MKKLILGALALTAAATLASSAVTQAGTSGVDLSTTGSIFLGLSGAQVGQEIPFSFTVKNKSGTAADLAVTFTVTNGTVSGGDYVCPLIGDHFDINPDTPSCEIGSLAAAKTAGAGILVEAIAIGTMTVKACASDLAGTSDPVPSNNCKTLKLRIE